MGPTCDLLLLGIYLLLLQSLSQMTLSEVLLNHLGKINCPHASALHVPPPWGTAMGNSMCLCLSSQRKRHWWQSALDPYQELIRNTDSGVPGLGKGSSLSWQEQQGLNGQKREEEKFLFYVRACSCATPPGTHRAVEAAGCLNPPTLTPPRDCNSAPSP